MVTPNSDCKPTHGMTRTSSCSTVLSQHRKLSRAPSVGAESNFWRGKVLMRVCSKRYKSSIPWAPQSVKTPHPLPAASSCKLGRHQHVSTSMLWKSEGKFCIAACKTWWQVGTVSEARSQLGLRVQGGVGSCCRAH